MKPKSLIALLVAVIMTFASVSVAFAADTSNSSANFGDVLYADEGITVFYGNPTENEELAKEVEAQYSRSLQYSYIWVDANKSATRYCYITASSSNPITYFTIRQESNSSVPRSRILVTRPQNNGTCYYSVWDGAATKEVSDLVISTNVLWNEPFGFNKYTWTSGTLTLRWDVQTGSSGARMCLWAW